MVSHDNVSRLFAAQIEPAFTHTLDDIAIPDRGPLEPQPLALQKVFKAKVAHHGGDQGIIGQPVFGRPSGRHESHELIPVTDLASLVDQDHAVRVTVQTNAHMGTVLHHRRCSAFGVG